ncbi:MAG: hypothetical protein RL189_904 [Pseudomonadota bacterium]|jgi:hypothetical protein
MASHTQTKVVTASALTLIAALTSCKDKNSQDWSENELQSLQVSLSSDSRPPEQILVRTMVLERELALRIINGWATVVNATEGRNPHSLLNQIKRIFDPDHLKPITDNQALKKLRTEGSGTHGSAKNQRQPQDSIYHAMWSRIADAAGIAGFSRSSKHMKHYLNNSGRPIRYANPETEKIISTMKSARSPDPSAEEAQFTAYQIRQRGRILGAEPSQSEAEMIGRMNQQERGFYLARIKVMKSLSEFIQKQRINTAGELVDAVKNISRKNYPVKGIGHDGDWTQHRPVGKHYGVMTSDANSDLYFALGAFTSGYSATPIEVREKEGRVDIRFAQSISIFDKYNWDEGKFVTLFTGWCWNLNSEHCTEIEKLTSLTVTDKTIGRLHKLGMAREFEVFGQTSVKTVWDSVLFSDLKSQQKRRVWDALEQTVSEFMQQVELMPD